MAAQTNLRAAPRKAFRSVLVAAYSQDICLALLKTHFSLFHTVIAYSIAGHVRLAGTALRPANSAAQRAAKRQLQLAAVLTL